jgi:hypothetical protein
MQDSFKSHEEVRRKLVSIKHWLHIRSPNKLHLEGKLYEFTV